MANTHASNLWDLFAQQTRLHPTRPFASTVDESTPLSWLSYQLAHDRAVDIAGALAIKATTDKTGRFQCVGYLGDGGQDALLTYLACAREGIAFLPLFQRMPLRHMHGVLFTSGCSIVQCSGMGYVKELLRCCGKFRDTPLKKIIVPVSVLEALPLEDELMDVVMDRGIELFTLELHLGSSRPHVSAAEAEDATLALNSPFENQRLGARATSGRDENLHNNPPTLDDRDENQHNDPSRTLHITLPHTHTPHPSDSAGSNPSHTTLSLCIALSDANIGANRDVLLAEISHANAIAEADHVNQTINSFHQRQVFGCTAPPVLYSFLPMAHRYTQATLNFVIFHGGSVGFSSTAGVRFLGEVRALKPTLLAVIPKCAVLLQQALLHQFKIAGKRQSDMTARDAITVTNGLSHVQCILSATGYCRTSTVEALGEIIGVDVMEFFGQCETSWLAFEISTVSPHHAWRNGLTELRLTSAAPGEKREDEHACRENAIPHRYFDFESPRNGSTCSFFSTSPNNREVRPASPTALTACFTCTSPRKTRLRPSPKKVYQVFLSSPCQFTRYYGRPGLTAAVLDEGGFVYTGNQAIRLDDGRIRVIAGNQAPRLPRLSKEKKLSWTGKCYEVDGVRVVPQESETAHRQSALTA